MIAVEVESEVAGEITRTGKVVVAVDGAYEGEVDGAGEITRAGKVVGKLLLVP